MCGRWVLRVCGRWVLADLAGMKAYVLETRGLEYAKGLFHDNAVRVYNL